MPPFRFGCATTLARPRKEWQDHARRVEDLGFATLLVADHYLTPYAPAPLMVSAADATTTLRVGSLVYDNDFRHPALLAKEAATVDVMTDGRLELGIGAGWLKAEYDAVGLSFDPPATRAARLEEAIDVIARLLAGERVTHEGEHYALRDLEGTPRPIQQPIPLFVGAGGPRLLALAGRSAQIVGLAPRSKREGGLDERDLGPEAMDDKARWVSEAAAAAGCPVPERNLLVQGVGDLPDERLAGSPHFFPGSADDVAEQVIAGRERWGISYLVCFDRDLEAFAPVVGRLAGA